MITFDTADRTRPRLALAISAVTLAAVLVACSSTAPPAVQTKPDATSGGADAGAYKITSLGCGSAGTQSVAAVSGLTVAFASLAVTTKTQTCSISPLGPVETSQVQLWDVCYAASVSGGSYTSQVVTSQPYLGPTGVGLAFDSAGNPSIAFTGVGSTPAAETCGANDAFVTSMQGGTFGTPVQVSNGSQSDGLIASQAGNCTAEQNVCGSGDATGFWPAIGIGPSGNAMIAYRDEHYDFAVDDWAKSDVELAEESGGSYSVLTIDVSRGGGTYNRIAFSPAGLPSVVQFDKTGQAPGVYIDSQVTAGAFSAQEASGAWVSQLISAGQVGVQLGFAISPQGLYAVAYYDEGTGRLLYTESKDGTTWSAPTSVDLNGTTGQYPSLAFDASGNPAIAYYRCSQVIESTTCDPSTDGLYLARRTGTAWVPAVISAKPDLTDGLYPALAFVGGKAVIAFQESSYDAISKTTSVSWWVAEEP